MNSTTTSSMPASYLAAAGMAQPASAVRGWFARAGLAVWRALEAIGHDRAMRELRNLHDRWEISDPSLARELRDASRFLLQAPHR